MDLVAASPQPTSISFLRFPTEVRLQIYGHHLVRANQPKDFKHPLDSSFSWIIRQPDRTSTQLAILRTCRLVHDEAREVLIRQTTWALHDTPFEASILASLDTKSRGFLRKVILLHHTWGLDMDTAMTNLIATLSEYPCLEVILPIHWAGLRYAQTMEQLSYLHGFAKVTLGSLSSDTSQLHASSPIFIDKSYGDREGPMRNFEDSMQFQEAFLRQLMKDLHSDRQPHVLEDGTVVKNMLQIAIYDLGFHY